MTRLPWSALVGLALSTVFLLLVFQPGAQAQDQQPGFGGIVGDLGEDAEQVAATSAAPDELMFRDSDDDGTLDQDESVYLVRSSTTQKGDVKIAAPFEGSAFTKISSGGADANREVSSLDGTIRYFDGNNDGSLTHGDTAYYDLDGSGAEKVSSGDVILAGEDAGAKVTSQHANLGFGLQDLDENPQYAFYDEEDDGSYDTGDPAIIDPDQDGWLGVGDVRLGSTGNGTGGTIVGPSAGDTTYTLDGFSNNWEFRYRDSDGDGTFDLTERAYLSEGEDVATFAIRLGNVPDEFEPGSQVIEQDWDWRSETTSMSGSLAYIDRGDDGFDTNDTLYHDRSASEDDEVSRGDLVLSGSSAGTVVKSGDDAIGESLASYDGDILFFDSDGSGSYGGADVVYADTDNDDIVESYDVQLSDGNDPYASDGGDDGEEEPTEPASIEITAPAEGAEVTVDGAVTVNGTADGGDAEIDEVTLTVEGGEADVDKVDGTANWTSTFTAREEATFTLVASVQPSSGETANTSITLEATVDDDSDDDGLADADDNCPQTANPDQNDTDEDGTGDPCDEDLDGDGITNEEDECPEEAGAATNDGCPIEDSDDDGLADDEDECPQEAGPDINQGCPEEQGDDTAADDGGEPNATDDGEQEGVPAAGVPAIAGLVSLAAIALRRRARA
jgi:hypothetical protein